MTPREWCVTGLAKFWPMSCVTWHLASDKILSNQSQVTPLAEQFEMVRYLDYHLECILQQKMAQEWLPWTTLSTELLLVVEKFSSELQFEPEPSRTELQVQFKVWKFFWTKPQVQFGVQPKLLQFELVQTTGFSRVIKAEILVIPNQILDLQTTFGLWLTNIDLIDDKIYFRMVI